MIPNEASCPVFSFTFRRKSVVELRMSGRKKKEKKKKRKPRACTFSFPSFFFSSLTFLCSPFVLPRFPVLCRERQSWFSIQFGELQNADACDFAEKEKRRVRIGPYVRVHGRPNANVCTFHTFPKSSQEKDVCDFCTCYALWRNGKKMERKDA